jgi:hypothetical protein
LGDIEIPVEDDRLFIGVFPCGISYADRKVEEHGDYKRLAFLPYSSLGLEWFKDCPESLRGRIIADASKIQARRGEDFQISAVGQTIKAGRESLIAVSIPTDRRIRYRVCTRRRW